MGEEMYDEWKEFDMGDGPYKIPFARFEEKEKKEFVFLLNTDFRAGFNRHNY